VVEPEPPEEETGRRRRDYEEPEEFPVAEEAARVRLIPNGTS